MSISSAPSIAGVALESETITEKPSRAQVHDADELARTAGLLLDTVQNETSAKFKNSAFMGLMRQLRDGEVIVEGNEMVQRSESVGGGQSTIDVKGKGRAVDIPSSGTNGMQLPTFQRRTITTPAEGTTITGDQSSDEAGGLHTEDPNDAYFRQENEEYIAMHSGLTGARQIPSSQFETQFQRQQAEWDNLQRDWETFEATAHGLRPLSGYEFQANNPYLSGETSRTRHHTAHSGMPQTLYEVCHGRNSIKVSHNLLMIFQLRR